MDESMTRSAFTLATPGYLSHFLIWCTEGNKTGDGIAGLMLLVHNGHRSDWLHLS